MLRRACTVAALLGLTACLWRSYATIVGVHLDVLTQTAAKLCAVVQAGRGPTAEDMAEYTYPLKRGREFLQQFSGYAERRSYQRFGAFLDRYEAMVRDLDAARAGDRQTAELPRLTAARDALEQQAAEIRTDLQAGN